MKELSKEQQALIEKEAEEYREDIDSNPILRMAQIDSVSASMSFQDGMTEVITNPEKYGLTTTYNHTKMMLGYEQTNLELAEENERLKEALKDIGSYKDEAFIHPHPQVLAKSMSLLALEALK